MPAFRNVRLCGKDCMCLYVCPTGATDTENSIIDASKCISCMACVNSCPSGAISMVPNQYPPPQPKMDVVVAQQRKLGYSKVRQEAMANTIVIASTSPVTKRFATAIARSNLRMAEDILRESGYMLAQSIDVYKLLEAILENSKPDCPKEAVKFLLNNLQKTSKGDI